MERKVLGRGLDVLIPQDTQGFKERVQMLKVSQVHPSPLQPRMNFSKEKIEGLSRSIKEKGVIQPILVRSKGADSYELIAGERRLRAVKHLGFDEIPAIIRRVADSELLEMSIIENIQREELNSIEEARAYQRLAQEFGLTQDSIASRVGKDKSSVSNLLRLLNLPDKVQDYLSQNLITFGHARALLSLSDEKTQVSFCQRIVKKGLSVRQTEVLTAHRARKRSAKLWAQTDPHLRNVEERLQHHLGTRVRIHAGKKRGRIDIEYYSAEDLGRLLRILGAA
ncbi:MAG: ParB/RepB/Spo0J family partition protein [Candidatus Omnitrophica bacterium]|nr:ParB/RepB/Spo0J family partition protein [Candidatus Omnitrophota bacterium]